MCGLRGFMSIDGRLHAVFRMSVAAAPGYDLWWTANRSGERAFPAVQDFAGGNDVPLRFWICAGNGRIDWEKPVAIASDVLDRGKDCKLLDQLHDVSQQKSRGPCR